MRPLVHVFTADDFAARRAASDRTIRRRIRRRALSWWLLIAAIRLAVLLPFAWRLDFDAAWCLLLAGIWCAFTTGGFLRTVKDLP